MVELQVKKHYLCSVILKIVLVMARPIRFAPVLTGNEATEFYERWQQSLKYPDPKYPSAERLEELKDFFKKQHMR